MIKVLELFAGIGACSKALERLGIEYEIVDAVEIDKYAIKSFNAIHGTNFEPQDVCEWDKDVEVDLIMHGSPCQDFSLAGRQAGGTKDSGTRSSLVYETIRIVNKLKPKYVIWENVRNLLCKKHKPVFDDYMQSMNELGYDNYYQILNAKDYGIPQNRERVFTISVLDDARFQFPLKQELTLRLKDMLEEAVDEKYYLRDEQVSKIKASTFVTNQRRVQEKGWCDTLCARDWKDPKCVEVSSGGNVPLIKIKNATKKGYQEAYEGDSVNLAYPDSTTRRGRVGSQTAQTLQCNDNMGVVVVDNMVEELEPKIIIDDTQGFDGTRVYDNYSPSLRATRSGLKTIQGCRIRKLTPKEYWRLMGFDDEDIDKCVHIGMSNTQLYKQAGNSIVVNVLEAILKNLIK